MGSLKKMMLGAALAVGAITVATVPAHAEVHFGVYLGGPAAYVPPCPGPGYVWVNGYWDDGAWTPGYWNFVGEGPADGYGYYGGGPYWRHDDGWRGDDDGFRGGWRGYDRHDEGFRGRGYEHGGGWGRGGRGGDHFRR